MDDHFLDDEEPESYIETHDGEKVLQEYSYEEYMEIEDLFRLHCMEHIHDLYEEIKNFRESTPDNTLFLDKMTLNSFIEFCFSCSLIQREVFE